MAQRGQINWWVQTEEKVHQYKIVNASVLADKKWQPLNIEQQRKIAWEQLNDPTGIPVSEIERIYSYKENGIVVKVNNFSFSNRITNGKANSLTFSPVDNPIKLS